VIVDDFRGHRRQLAVPVDDRLRGGLRFSHDARAL
jgi:hypothetical protein